MKLGFVLSAVIAALAIGSSADLASDLASNSRAEADRARDAGRKPAEVIAFLGIGSGMKVMDLIAAGGYYTEVLSLAVGDSGTVYAQNPARVLQFRDGANDTALTARLADARLANVVRLDKEIGATGVAPGSLDAAITALNFHDIYNGAGADAAAGFLQAVHALLKPGGVLGVIDHYGDADKDNASLHRLDVAAARSVLEASGFDVTSSDLLRNPADDRTKGVFDPSVRGYTDRVLFKLTKP